MGYTTSGIRNLALVGQAGAGKTSLLETLLLQARAIRSRGTLARGTTVSDFDPQEKRLQHSLDTAIAGFDSHGSYDDQYSLAAWIYPTAKTGAIVTKVQDVTEPNGHGFNLYDGTTEVGSIEGNEGVTDLLGLTNTEFSVESVTAAAGESGSSALPTVGSVYDVFNLGGGFENVYTDIAGATASADTITDTFVTPFGNIDLGSLFGGIDAILPLDPGDAFTGGLDAATAAASAIDPLAFLGL